MLSSAKLYVYGLIAQFLPETKAFKFKASLLRWCGAEVGKGARICSTARFVGCGELRIGDETWVGPGVFISSGARVEIGARVDIAPFVFIGTGTHEIVNAGPRVAGKGCHNEVTIKDGSWIGVRSVLLPGMVVGSRAIVAAGSVVTKSVPDGCLVAGVPSTVKRNKN